jgi:hypothetical protein
LAWAFEWSDPERGWRWQLTDDDTSIVVKRSETPYSTLIACIYHAIQNGYVPPPDRAAPADSEIRRTAEP